MALSREILPPLALIPLAELREERVVKKLIAEGRTPYLRRYEEVVICFIPAGNSGSEQKLEVSMLDAKEIATTRDKLQREI